MDLIYRLETLKGDGVFRSGLMGCLTGRQYDRAHSHPGPRSPEEAVYGKASKLGESSYPLWDALDRDGSCFGFATIAQGRSWFGRRALRKLWERSGVYLKVYDRAKCRGLVQGRKQCVFIRPKELGRLPAHALWWTESEIKAALGLP
jgi:hypothetical protein